MAAAGSVYDPFQGSNSVYKKPQVVGGMTPPTPAPLTGAGFSSYTPTVLKPTATGGVGGSAVAGGGLPAGAEPGNYYATQPYITSEYRPMEGFLRQIMMERLKNNSLPPEYAAQGLQNINSSYGDAKMGLENQLATAGMYGGSQLAAGFGNLESGRMGEVAGFQNSLPMLQRALQNEDLAASAALTSAFGRGQGGFSRENQMGGSSSASSSSGGGGGGSTILPPGTSPLAGAFGDFASTLASLYGAGMFGGSKKKPAANVV